MGAIVPAKFIIAEVKLNQSETLLFTEYPRIFIDYVAGPTKILYDGIFVDH